MEMAFLNSYKLLLIREENFNFGLQKKLSSRAYTLGGKMAKKLGRTNKQVLYHE